MARLSFLPREERRNFKADKQEVCIIPLVPEEGGERGPEGGNEEEEARQQAPCLS